MTTPPPPPDDAERVRSWLLAWVSKVLDEDTLCKRLNTYIWHIEGATWTMWTALRGNLHAVLVQLREAAVEYDENDPRECGMSARSLVRRCEAREMCGRHRDAQGAWFDVLDTFVGIVEVQVPIRAAASVEASMAAVRDRVLPEKGKGKA